MTKFTLKAQKRVLFGNKVKSLRRQGVVPGNVFGKEIESQAIQVQNTEFERVYKQAGETSLIWLEIEGESKDRPTLVTGLHKNPVTGKKVHIDFHQVNLKEKVTSHVPVEIIGISELINSGAAVLNQSLNEIEIEALPTEIPESIIFDISSLKEIGDHLLVSDAKISGDIEIKIDPTLPVVSLAEPQKEEVAPVEEVAAEGEATPAAEGEAAPTEKSPEEK